MNPLPPVTTARRPGGRTGRPGQLSTAGIVGQPRTRVGQWPDAAPASDPDLPVGKGVAPIPAAGRYRFPE